MGLARTLTLTLALALHPHQVWEACPASCSAHGAAKGAHLEFGAEIGTIGLSVDGLPFDDFAPKTTAASSSAAIVKP